MNHLAISAPAKVNLFLKVLNKREDSYHNILTLFEKISLSDDLVIRKIPKGIEVRSDKFITASQKDNIVYRAAELILNYGKVRAGVSIHIIKRIPIAAGLGGGSSDAASALTGINRLFGLRLKTSALMALGARLGADVPFFILNTPLAIGVKRGDELESVELDRPLWHLIVYPGFKLASKDVYNRYDTSRMPRGLIPRRSSGSSGELLPNHLTTKKSNVKIYPPSLKLRRIALRSLGKVGHIPLKQHMDFEAFQSMLHNDLEDIVIVKNTVVSKILKRLASSLGRKAIMSGSGPSVFCLCKTRKEAIEGRRKLFSRLSAEEIKNWQVFIARTTN